MAAIPNEAMIGRLEMGSAPRQGKKEVQRHLDAQGPEGAVDVEVALGGRKQVLGEGQVRRVPV